MTPMGFLRAFGGALSAAARGLAAVQALPKPESESDGKGRYGALAIAHAGGLVPDDVNDLITTTRGTAHTRRSSLVGGTLGT